MKLQYATWYLERSVSKHWELVLVIDRQLLRFDDEVSPFPVSREGHLLLGI